MMMKKFQLDLMVHRVGAILAVRVLGKNQDLYSFLPVLLLESIPHSADSNHVKSFTLICPHCSNFL